MALRYAAALPCLVGAVSLGQGAGAAKITKTTPLASEVPDFGPGFNPTTADNMNGDFVIATTPGGTPGLFPKRFADYPGGVEAYDVLSPPMTTYYSQVWWSPLAPVGFPEEMVKKYAGQQVAIVGWEIDQVRVTDSGEEVSVPISATYNHHYNAQIIGAASRFKKVHLSGPDDPLAQDLLKTSHGRIQFDQPYYIAEQIADSKGSSSAFVTSGNGGEYRKTFHGYAPGYAVVVESPTQLQLSPMQIDTWNRDKMNISGPLPPKFVPGPLPREAEAPENAAYSGLLECPMTTRITKAVEGGYDVESNQAACSDNTPVLTFQECYHAAASTLRTGGQTFINSTGSDPTRPVGCSVTTDDAVSSSQISVFFNSLKNSSTGCATKAPLLVGATMSLVNVSVTLDVLNDRATISMTGPSDVWFGVGFGAQNMGDQPWTLVVDGGTGTVSEHKIGTGSTSHTPGTVLKPSVTVVSSSATSGLRTVVVSRKLAGASADYYSFNTTAANPQISFINAVGSGPQLAYHKDKAPSSLTLLPAQSSASAGACVCPVDPPAFGQAVGSLVYHAGNQSVDIGTGAVGFGKQKCAKFPMTTLNEMKNPTCDIRYYRGGQWACHHKWSLLDADQEIPWTDQPLVFHHKWRVYVQPFNASYHKPVTYGYRGSLLIGSPYEYDVPKCADGVPGCELVNGTWIHTITGSKIGSDTFAQLNFHCHAPTCLSMSVYTCDPSVAVEDCNATVGKLVCEQRPVYGGTGAPELNGTRFDETGYVAIPDCVWGGAEFGLEAPFNWTGIPVHMVKTANATYGHYGEMAGGQPWILSE